MTSPLKPIMSCERFSEMLPDLLEREVPDGTRAEMEAHALVCDECGPLLADLRKLRIDAANLGDLAPGRDLWSGIAARIETPIVSIGAAARDRNQMTRRRRRAIGLGLAAAGLIAVTAITTYQITRQSFENQRGTGDIASLPTTAAPAAAAASLAANGGSTASAPVAGIADTAVRGLVTPAARKAPQTTQATQAPTPAVSLASNVSSKLSPAQTYDLEISRLRLVVDRRRADLDSTTVAVLERNLRIIDDAIAQCRQALETDPSSMYLNESLIDALDNKVELLRTAASLPSAL